MTCKTSAGKLALDKADPTQSTYLDFDKLLSYRRVVPSKILKKFSIGKMGHKSSLIMPMIIFMPFLSWSVFECFMLMDSMYRWTFWIVSCDICIGQVYIGSQLLSEGVVISPEWQKPRKAMVEADHSIRLSYDGLVSEGNHTLFIKRWIWR